MICIYCKGDSDNAAGREHVLPECLGFKLELERGVVCDRCNQYLKRLDEAVLMHPRVAESVMLSRALRKSGKPMMKTQDGQMVIEEFGGGRRVLKYRWASPRHISLATGGTIPLEIDLPKEFKMTRFVRCLHKMAMNVFAWQKGADITLAHEFDHVREYVRQPVPSEYRPVAIHRSTQTRESSCRLVSVKGHLVIDIKAGWLSFAVALTGDHVNAAATLGEYATALGGILVLENLGKARQELLPKSPERSGVLSTTGPSVVLTGFAITLGTIADAPSERHDVANSEVESTGSEP